MWPLLSLLVDKDNLHIHIFSIFVEKILQEIGNWVKRDVATNNNMSERRKARSIISHQSSYYLCWTFNVNYFCMLLML